MLSLEQRKKKAEYARKFRAANPEKALGYKRKWSRENRGQELKSKAKWRAVNAEKIRERNRKRLGQPEPTRPRPDFCEICYRKSNGKGVLHLDHCHETGTFRGWLCHNCNTGLGKLGDNLELVLKRVAEYKARQ